MLLIFTKKKLEEDVVKKGKEIISLKNKVEKLEKDAMLYDNKDALIKKLEKKIEDTDNNLNKVVKVKSELDLEFVESKAKLELLSKQLLNQKQITKDIESTLEQYRKLPDLNNMISNIQSLSAPSIDKLVEVMKTNKPLDVKSIVSDIKDGLGEEIYKAVGSAMPIGRRY